MMSCIYRPSMYLSEFNSLYLAKFVFTFSENKALVLPGDLNTDLVKYD